MTRLIVAQPQGMHPKLADEQLPDNAAARAVACRIASGNLRPWANDSTVGTVGAGSTVKTLYRFGQDVTDEDRYWFQFPDDVDVIRSPVHADAHERTYWTGQVDVDGHTYMRYASNSMALLGAPYPSSSAKVGLPVPATPTAIVNGAAGATDIPETRFYVITYVTALGEEGPACNPAGPLAVAAAQTVTLSLGAVPAGRNIERIRIYRTNQGSQAAQFQFVHEVMAGTTSYTDNKSDAALGEVLPSLRWFEPPRNLVGLTLMANGVCVGFVRGTNQLYFSEPFLPHAWDPRNMQTTEHPIVALRTMGQSVLVMTQSYPWVATGVDPSAMSLERLPVPQACVSKRSTCVTERGIVFASPDGLCLFDGQRVQLITSDVFTREQWQAFKPATMVSHVHDDKLLVSYDAGAAGKDTLIFDFRGELPRFSFAGWHAEAKYHEPLNDALYFVDGLNVRKWASGAGTRSVQWKSKRFKLATPQGLTCYRVMGQRFENCQLTIWADGRPLLWRQPIRGQQVGRLPMGRRYENVQFEITGTDLDVMAVIISSSPQECRL